ncbi:MAG: aminopeptidase P family N-terminal domain-containing protein, partial [Chloroflexi bacterium]|nr:aminopeptidase P family N-terminal domain-containing protein [Chloroflexota bacterium]
MSKWPYGIGSTDYQAGINFARLRQERLARAQAALKRHGVAAALLMRPDNMRYATAVRGHEFAAQLSYALVFAEHEPVLYELGDMVEHQQRYCPWIRPENWRCSYSWLGSIGGREAATAEAKLFAAAIVRDLKERGLYGQKLGSDALDDVGRQALAEVGVEVTPIQTALREARRNKTQDEVACIRTAIAITNAGYASQAAFRPGMRERDAGALAYDAMMRAGAEMVSGGMRSGPNTFDVYHIGNTDRIVDPGDLAQVNLCGTSFAGYKMCIYR